MEDQYKKEIEEGTLKRKVKKKDKKRFKEDEDGEDGLRTDKDKEMEEKMDEDMRDIEEDSENEGGIQNENAAEAFVNPLKAKINEIVQDKEGPPEDGSKRGKKRSKPEKGLPLSDDDGII